MKTKRFFSLLSVLLIALACNASAGLITNPGFEDGNFNGWVLGGDTSFSGVSSSAPHSGTFAADLSTSEGIGSLSQSLATTAGAHYDLSFFMFQEVGKSGSEIGPLPPLGFASFQVFWNGMMVFDSPGGPSFYQQFNVAGLVGTGSDVLQFRFQNGFSIFHLDDVSLTQAQGNGVPETFSTLWLALPMIGMAGFARLRRKQA